MKVATEPFGNAEFNYPEIKLNQLPANSSEKIIGEEENSERPEKPATPTKEETVLPEDITKQVNNIVKKAETQQAPQPAHTQPPSVAKPAPKPASAPIPLPMAEGAS